MYFLIALLVGFAVYAAMKMAGTAEKALVLEQRLEDIARRLAEAERKLKRLAEAPPAPKTPDPAPAPQETPIVSTIAEAVALKARDLAGASAIDSASLDTRGPVPTDAPPPIPAFPAIATPPVIATGPALPPAPSASAPLPEPPPAASVPAFNLEQFMGVKLLAWVSGFAAFLFVALGLKYSIDHNWITPAMRATAGFALGAGALAGGIRLARRQYEVLAQTLCAVGVAALYASTFASHVLYRFPAFGIATTFAIMAGITAVAFVLAARMNAQVVALLGMLGGFLTPLILSTGEDCALALFGYVAALDAGLAAVALQRRWHYMVLLASLGSVIMELAWADRFFAPEKIRTAQAVFLVFCVFFCGEFALAERRRLANGWHIAAALLPVATAFGFAGHLLASPAWGERPGEIFAVVLGADLCALALAWVRPRLAAVQTLAGTAAFACVAWWLGECLTGPQLYWGLGLCLGFAALHSGCPVALARWRPGARLDRWANVFPAVSVAMALFPILRLSETPFTIWVAVFALDALAVGLAMATGVAAAVLAALVLTLFAAGVWIFKAPAMPGIQADMLIVVGLSALFFLMAGLFAGERILRRSLNNEEEDADSRLAACQIPALSVLLPFALLTLIVAKLPLDNPSAVFGLGMLMAGAALGLAWMRRERWLPLAALAGTLILEHTWHWQRFTPGNAPTTLGWNLGFFALFFAFPFLCRGRLLNCSGAWAASALAGPLHFYLFHDVIGRAWPNDMMGLIPAILAAPYAAGLWLLARTVPKDAPARNGLLAWMGGAALFFVTLIFPVQFHREWLTLGWALEGAALLWLYHRVPHNGLRWTGVALLLAAFARLGLNPAVLEYHARLETPLLNWYLYAYGAAAACLFAGARLLAPPRNQLHGSDVPPVLWTLGTVLLFLLANIEVADAFGEGPALTFQFSGNFARDMSYTIVWSLFALGLLGVGAWRAIRAARYAALGLIAAAVLKLFFHDLASLGPLYRLGALVSVAAIGLLGSFVYQRFLNARAAGEKGGKPS